MILTPHILSGAAVATQTSNPILVILLATVLHYILDAVPHWDYDIYSSKKTAIQKISVDIFAASLIVLFAIWNLPLEKQLLILMGGFFGVLPDGILFLNIISGNTLFVRYVKFHHFWHWLIAKKEQRPPLALGILPQILIAAISIYALAIT